MNRENIEIDLVNRIKNYKLDNDFIIMEICGTHTQSISKLGIRKLFYPKIRLVSGPGCPVCVTSESFIDAAIDLLDYPNIILTTFGDLMKVKGSNSNLIEEREEGKNIKIVYSPLDALKIAEENKNHEIVFIAVGFETTAPLIGLAVKMAKEKNIFNFSILSSLKTMKPIISNILDDKDCKINGIICPGHVAVITGSDYFTFITKKYSIPAVISGFSGLDILSSIYFLITENNRNIKGFENYYRTCVSKHGNLLAKKIINHCFIKGESLWRGIGTFKESGLYLNKNYEQFDAVKKFHLKFKNRVHNSCVCSEIILGKKFPYDCNLFGKVCTPASPVGPCMVSSEGACSVYYKWGY